MTKHEQAKRAQAEGYALVLWSGKWCKDRYFKEPEKENAIGMLRKGEIIMSISPYVDEFCEVLNG